MKTVGQSLSLVLPLVGGVEVAVPQACSSKGWPGGACGSVLLQQATSSSMRLATADVQAADEDVCDEEAWPDKDHNLVCGECKVLVNNFNSIYKTCDGYCATIGRQCVGAWEEQGDTCTVLHDMTCDQTIASSDAICQCGEQVSDGSGAQDGGTSSGADSGDASDDGADMCYGELAQVAADEGHGIGAPEISASSDGPCKDACSGNDKCKSFAYCPSENKCWLKDRSLSDGESTKSVGTCKTYYQRPCGGQPAPSSSPPEQVSDGSGAQDGGASSGADSGDAPEEGAEVCYGEFTQLAADEGHGIGAPEISASSDGTCKDACRGNDKCKSFAYCPSWNKCWLKDRSFSGGESTKSVGTCKTYYKRPCGGQPAPSPSPPSGSAGPEVRVVSYNLFWWNAHDQNPWKFQSIADNIKFTLQADVLGLQECDSPAVIKDRTGYEAVSPFEGAQGVAVHPGRFRVGRTGARDLQATGKWGPRYVTWAELTHVGSERTFWIFNTHWCVHSGNGRTCNSNVRHAGAKNMLDAIRQEAGSAPVLITGDFNAAMGEAGPQHFLANGFGLARSSWVDAIFYTKAHWQVISTSTGSHASSDHAPVIATLKMK